MITPLSSEPLVTEHDIVFGCVAVHEHLIRGIAAVLAMLLVGGTAVADRTNDPWREAIRNSDVEVLKQLAGSGVDVNAGARYGKTALMVAAAKGDLKLMRRLIAFGAEVNRVNRAGGNALMYAAQYGQRGAAELLIQRGANINHRGGKGWSALMVAVLKGRSNMVEFLLEHRADPNVSDVLGWTPLMRAVGAADSAIVRSLMIRPDVDLNARNLHGQNALHIAVIAGTTGIAAALVDRGVASNVADNDGNTPLAIAEQKAHAPLVRLLSEHR